MKQVKPIHCQAPQCNVGKLQNGKLVARVHFNRIEQPKNMGKLQTEELVARIHFNRIEQNKELVARIHAKQTRKLVARLPDHPHVGFDASIHVHRANAASINQQIGQENCHQGKNATQDTSCILLSGQPFHSQLCDADNAVCWFNDRNKTTGTGRIIPSFPAPGQHPVHSQETT